MRIEWSQNRHAVQLKCMGRDLGENDQRQLTGALNDTLNLKQTRVILDMTELVIKNLAEDLPRLIHVLDETLAAYARHGKELAVCIRTPAIWSGLAKAGLADKLAIYGSADEALEAWLPDKDAMTSEPQAAAHKQQQALDAILAGAVSEQTDPDGVATICGAKDCAFYRLRDGEARCIHTNPEFAHQRGRCSLFMLNWAKTVGAPPTPPAAASSSATPADVKAPTKGLKRNVNEIIAQLALIDEKQLREEKQEGPAADKPAERSFSGIVLTAPTAEELAAVGLSPTLKQPGPRAGKRILGTPVSKEEPSAAPPEPRKGAPHPNTPSRATPSAAATSAASGGDKTGDSGPRKATTNRERPSAAVRRFIEAWNKKDWETEYHHLGQALRSVPLTTYASMREAECNKLRLAKECPVHVLDHIVEENADSTHARVAVRRSDYINNVKKREYQQIFLLEWAGGRWQIHSVQEVRKPSARGLASSPKNKQ